MAKVTIKGWQGHVTKMAKAADRICGDRGAGQILDAVGRAIVAQYNANIEKGSAAGKKFRRLSEPYATHKAKKYGRQPILVASGSMRDSFAWKLSHLGPAKWRLVAGVGGSDARGVSNGAKATWHTEGTPSMPKRDFGAMPKKHLAKAARDEFVKLHRQAYGKAAA